MTRCTGFLFAALAAAAVAACAGSPLPRIEPIANAPQLSTSAASQPLPPALPPASAQKAVTAEPAANSRIPPNAPHVAGASGAVGTAPGEMIVGLKRDTIVLYREEGGFDGERVVAASFMLPAPARPSGNPRRLEVLTAAGVRWVDRAEVVVNTPAPNTPAP